MSIVRWTETAIRQKEKLNISSIYDNSFVVAC
jgi:hypothetical protein